MTKAFCTDCGNQIETDSRFCASCGVAIQTDLPLHEGVARRVPDVPSQIPRPPVSPANDTPSNQRIETPYAAIAQTVIHNTVAMMAPAKSVGVAFFLAFFFGPLGMLYSTVTGAITMFFVSLLALLLTAGLGLFITWPICIVWACVATSSYNAALVAANSGGPPLSQRT